MSERPRLLVHRDLRRQLLRLPPRPWEVGGWLLGYWSEDLRSVMLTHATPPALRGTAFGVTISGTGHRDKFNAAWAASDGLITFIGDWHTHPGGPTVPSQQDQRAMRQLAEDADYGTPIPVIAIAACPRLKGSATQRDVGFYSRAPDGTIHRLGPELVDELPEPAQAIPRWPWPSAVDT